MRKYRITQTLLMLCLPFLVGGCAAGHSDALMSQAHNLYVSGHLEQCEAVYKQLLQTERVGAMRVAASMQLERCYLKERKSAEALKAGEEALKECKVVFGSPDELELSIQFLNVCACEQAGQYDVALARSKSLLALADSLAPQFKIRRYLIVLKMADISTSAGNYKQAIALYRSLPTGNVSCLQQISNLRLAICLAKAGLNAEAEQQFKSCLPTQKTRLAFGSGAERAFALYSEFLRRQNRKSDAAAIESRALSWAKENRDFICWFKEKNAPASRLGPLDGYLNQEYESLAL